MSEARNRIDAVLHGWDDKKGHGELAESAVTRVHVFIRKEQLAGESLDRMLQDYVDAGWFVLVRHGKVHPAIIGLTFCKDSKYHYGSNPNFV